MRFSAGGQSRAMRGQAAPSQSLLGAGGGGTSGLMSTPVEITWLLAAVAKGDAVAFERLYGATCPNLYGVALRILRRHDLAAEVMEQAYLQVWRDAADYDPARLTPLAWMVAIARRLAIDVARAPQPPATDSEPEISEEDEGPGSVPRHELTDNLKQLLTCIGRLEPDHQRMLLLAYYGAFSRDQLSAKLAMPIDLVRASLRRSLLEIDEGLKS
jgi:RNA polymerase sigma-70 factor, ECF subfamily